MGILEGCSRDMLIVLDVFLPSRNFIGIVYAVDFHVSKSSLIIHSVIISEL